MTLLRQPQEKAMRQQQMTRLIHSLPQLTHHQRQQRMGLHQNAHILIANRAYQISAAGLFYQQPVKPSTAWNSDCRAWLMIWPFHASVSV